MSSSINPTNEHREQARRSSPNLRAQDLAWLLVYDFEMTDCRCDQVTLTAGVKANLEQRIAAALSSHDTEVREVLEGLRGRTGSQNCWCDAEDEDSHYLSCLAADELYARLQPKESSDVTE